MIAYLTSLTYILRFKNRLEYFMCLISANDLWTSLCYPFSLIKLIFVNFRIAQRHEKNVKPSSTDFLSCCGMRTTLLRLPNCFRPFCSNSWLVPANFLTTTPRIVTLVTNGSASAYPSWFGTIRQWQGECLVKMHCTVYLIFCQIWQPILLLLIFSRNPIGRNVALLGLMIVSEKLPR